MMVARELVWLGWCLALEVEDDRGKVAARKWPPRRMGLFSNMDGTALYILPVKNPERVQVPDGRHKAKKLYRLWSAFDPSHAVRFAIPDAASTLHVCGTPRSVLYLSDKWTGKPTRYIHAFTKSPRAYADAPKRPRTFGIMFTDGKRLVSARGVIG